MVKNPAKRERKNKPTSKKYKFYGEIKGKTCPRCGPGIFLAQASNRVYCGRCHFTEFQTKPAEPKSEAKAEAKPTEKPKEEK